MNVLMSCFIYLWTWLTVVRVYYLKAYNKEEEIGGSSPVVAWVTSNA